MTAPIPQRTLRAVLLALVLALPWALAGPAAEAQAPPPPGNAPDDALQPHPGLDPWNVQIERLPKWDLEHSPPPLAARARRHMEYLQAGIPLEYRSRRDPYPKASMVVQQGGALYRDHCKACHGAQGHGDGDAGRDLTPSPALLARLMQAQGSVDEYLLWSISEGGKPFDTAMPAFKNRLTEDQIWKIVTYMRSGFPSVQ